MRKFWVVVRPDPVFGAREYRIDANGLNLRSLEYPERLVREETYVTIDEMKIPFILGISLGAFSAGILGMVLGAWYL